MNIGEQLKALEKTRGEHITAVEKIVEGAEKEDRALTDEEQKQYDEHQVQVKGLDARMVTLRSMEELVKARVQPAAPEQRAVTPWGDGARAGNPPRDKGAIFGAMARAMYATKGNLWNAHIYAKEVMHDDELSIICKAAVAPGDTTVSGWASQLVTQATQGFWDLLRPASVYARYPGVQAVLGNNGEVLLPGASVGVQGAWVGQNNPIPVKKPTFTAGSLKPLKLGVISVVSRELLAQSNPSVDTILRDMMIKDTALVLDTTFCDNTAASAGVRPAGLMTYDSSATAATGTTIDKIDADLKVVLAAAIAANLNLGSCVFILNEARVLGLQFVMNANGVYPYRDMVNNGNIFGVPFIASNACGTGDVILSDSSAVVKLVNGTPEIAVSEDATLHMEDTTPLAISTAATPNTVAAPVRSMFQTNDVALRLIMPAAWAVARGSSVQVITGAAW